MNRRSFLATSAASIAALTYLPTAALDVERLESPMMRLLDCIPDREGVDGRSFPPTRATNFVIKALAPGENPDMYWDPYSSDLMKLFGFSRAAHRQTAWQLEPELLELWSLDVEHMNPADVVTQMQFQGWAVVDEDLRLFQYSGSDEDRTALADDMDLLDSAISNGDWDHIAIPNDNTMVLGAGSEFVREAADRVKHHTALTTVRENFHALGSMVPVNAYEMVLLPPESPPVRGGIATFACKSYESPGPIIHSIGVRTTDENQANALVHEVPQRISTITSPITNLRYSDFLDLENVVTEYSAVRFDFVVTDGEWDVVDAAAAGDLLMFPFSE